MEANIKRREWVKTAAIIFLVVLLVLTFFSNTIMNRSLPEVATQSVQSGSINARIRGSGTVAANETYDVTISQTRKIASVLVKVGQTVEAGDKLFLLDSMESSDLTTARTDLENMELAYEKGLVDAAKTAAQSNREIQLAQQKLEEAQAVARQYGSLSASQIAQEKAAAEQKKKSMTRELGDLTKSKEKAEKEKADASTGITELETNFTAISSLKDAVDALKRDQVLYKEHHDALWRFAKFLIRQNDANSYQNVTQVAAALAKDQSFFDAKVGSYAGQYIYDDIKDDFNVSYFLDSDNSFAKVSKAYTVLEADQAAIDALNPLEMNFQVARKDSNGAILKDKVTDRVIIDNDTVDAVYKDILDDLGEKKDAIAKYDTIIEQYDNSITTLNNAIEDQTDYITDLDAATSSANAVKDAKDELERLVFEQGLPDSSDLQVQADKEAIEKKKEEIKKLEADAEGGEVTAKVSGVIGAINVTAGNTIGPEQALATIQVVDRGYTIKISVTADQAKKVRVGDKADLVNYWGGDIDATLENIANDPSNPGKGKLLVFRLSGEVEPDTNLTLSIGQKSANYDCLVPNSAVRSDSNGSFVLAVVVKSSPLGNRYTATRVDVKVLASDDTMSAVSGLSQGDFVITTSTKPIEAGTLVRLAENG